MTFVISYSSSPILGHSPLKGHIPDFLTTAKAIDPKTLLINPLMLPFISTDFLVNFWCPQRAPARHQPLNLSASAGENYEGMQSLPMSLF